MALQTKTYSTGSFEHGGDSNGYILDLILTEESTDAATNTSLVSYQLQLRSGSSNRFDWELTSVLSLNSTQVAANKEAKYLDYNATWVLLSGSTTVSHGADGALNMTYSATVTPWNNGNQYTPPTLTVSGSMALTNIPRASTIAATSAYIGDATTITVDKKSTQFYHSIHYQFGTLSGYLASTTGAVSEEDFRLGGTTIVFPIPSSFYAQIPNSPSGVCTLTCKTYSGNTQIGNAETATFTVTANPARCSPVVSATAKDTNAATLALTGNEKTFVSGKSNVQCSISASGQGGATIRELYVNGTKISGNTYTLNGIATKAITVRAVDSRGYPKEYTIPGLSLVAYVPVSYTAVAKRTDPTNGEAQLTVSGKWFAGNFGAVSNTLTAQYQIDGGAWIPFTPSTTGGDIQATIPLSGKNYLRSYTIHVKLSDKFAANTKKVILQKGTPVFDWGENDFRFNVPVSIMGSTLFTRFETSEDVDNFVFGDDKLHMGYGIVQEDEAFIGYIGFAIGWITLQFLIQPEGVVRRRSKYGNSAWSDWTLV